MSMGGVCLRVCLIHARAVPWESIATAGVGLPSHDLFLPQVRDEAHYADPSIEGDGKRPLQFFGTSH